MSTETNIALSAENQNSEAVVFTLSENQKQAISKAREQIKRGLQYFTNDLVDK